MRENTNPKTYLMFGSAGSVTRDNILIAASAMVLVAVLTIRIPFPAGLALAILVILGSSIGIRQSLYPAYHTMTVAYFQWLAITVLSLAWALIATSPHFLWPPLVSLLAFGATHIIANQKSKHP
jgi:hypothetical protein